MKLYKGYSPKLNKLKNSFASIERSTKHLLSEKKLDRTSRDSDNCIENIQIEVTPTNIRANKFNKIVINNYSIYIQVYPTVVNCKLLYTAQ